MDRGRKRALALWVCYQRRKMITYVAKEKAYKKMVVDFLASDAVDLLQISDDSVKVNVCHQKFDNIIYTLQSIPHPPIPDGLQPPHLDNIATIVSSIKQSVA